MPKSFVALCIISLLAKQLLYSQDAGVTDSLVRYADLRFSSSNEKQAFDELSDPTPGHYFKLALNAIPKGSETSYDYEEHFNKVSQKIGTTEFIAMKPEKKVKIIYSGVQDELLRKYNAKATFNQIFLKGEYNCVTASMLYGIMLLRYNIPFEVKETPEHVYLVTKPGKKSMMLESTDPVLGYVSYNDTYKEHFIKYLQDHKMISSDELVKNGIDSIFNRFYFPHTSIGLKELAGIQYSNNAIFALQENNFRTAFDQLQKSYFLYPSEKSRYLAFSTLSLLLLNASYQNEEDWNYYVCYSRLKGGIISNDAFKSEFSRMTQKILIEKSNPEKFHKAYQFISNGITDTSLRKDISAIYNFEMAKYHLTTNRIIEAFPYIEEAYRLTPENFDVKNLFFSTFYLRLGYCSEDEGLEFIQKYSERYEQLRNDSRLISMMTEYYLRKASSAYDDEKWEDGNKFLVKYEEIADTYPGGINEYQVEEVYITIAAHYFKVNNVKRSKEYILKGLKYYPSSFRLQKSLKTVN
jgi:hypothetical protein